jgi:hypothetical protein
MADVDAEGEKEEVKGGTVRKETVAERRAPILKQKETGVTLKTGGEGKGKGGLKKPKGDASNKKKTPAACCG